MIQLKVLNYVLENKDIDIINVHDSKYFSNYTEEYNFIKQYIAEHNTTPDIMTMINAFEGFTLMHVEESREYLLDKLYEDYVYINTVHAINDNLSLFRYNPIAGKKAILEALNAIE